MSLKRRKLIQLLSLGALMPNQILKNVSSLTKNPTPSESLIKNIDKIYEKAIVFDGLLIPRGWDEASFLALAESGYTGFNASLNSRNLSSALASIREWTRRIRENPDKLLLATRAEDIELAKKENKVAVLYGFQNSSMMEGSVDNLDILYQAGTRWIQLTYNERNLIGDGCTERTNAGLSDFGISAVERMNELGIIIDLSHCGRQTTLDGIQFSKSGATFNHTMCEALYPNHPRAKTDKQIRAMAEKGGIMGIICLGYMIGPDPGRTTTIDTYVDHIDHAVNIAGIDHVGLAADFAIQGLQADGATRENWYLPRLTRFKPSYQVKWPPWIPELDSPHRYRNVARVLDQRGYRTGDIEKILGTNWMRYFRETLQ